MLAKFVPGSPSSSLDNELSALEGRPERERDLQVIGLIESASGVIGLTSAATVPNRITQLAWGAADLHLDPRFGAAPALDRSVEDADRAGAFGITLQAQHIGVAVNDAGGGREQRRRALQRGFHRQRIFPRQPAEVGDAIGRGAGADAVELLSLRVIGCHDQLAAIGVRDAAFRAIGIKLLPAGDAGAGHEAAGGVVDAGMDHFGVAGAGLGPDALGGIEDDHLAPRFGQRAGHGEAHDAGPGDDAIHLLHRLSAP